MIVIGYQGIGKSTLSNSDLQFIDLESSNFFVNGKRDEKWYIPYCQIAEHLSKQGYIVFTSSHDVVRNQLFNCTEQVICCVPDLSLKKRWIEKLHDRWIRTNLDKDYKALANAEARYEENIKEIANSKFGILWIENMDYNLRQLCLQSVLN